jgi:FkbM family methyltransferase
MTDDELLEAMQPYMQHPQFAAMVKKIDDFWAKPHAPVEYEGFLKGYKLADGFGSSVWISGGFKQQQTSVTIAALRPGDVCIDVGANVGFYTLVMSRAVGPIGKVYAFEPVPPTFKQLQDNLRETNSSNVEAFQVAMSNKVGEGELVFKHACDLDACVHGEGTYVPDPGLLPIHKTPLTTLDVFVAERNLSRLDFIKTDCQGSDLSVLEAGSVSINRFRPKIICEAIGHERIAAIHKFFETINYYSVCVEAGTSGQTPTEHILGVPFIQ